MVVVVHTGVELDVPIFDEAAKAVQIYFEGMDADDEDIHQVLADPGFHIVAIVVAAGDGGGDAGRKQQGPPSLRRDLLQHVARFADEIRHAVAVFPLVPGWKTGRVPGKEEIDAIQVVVLGHFPQDGDFVIAHSFHREVEERTRTPAAGDHPIGMLCYDGQRA